MVEVRVVHHILHVLVCIGCLLIMGWFLRSLGSSKWDLDTVEPPWGTRPAIYDHVVAHLDNGRLTQEGDTLPDEPTETDENRLRWVSGGLDGAFGHHGGGGDSTDSAEKIFEQLRKVLAKPSSKRLQTFYELLAGTSALEVVDPLLEQIVTTEGIDAVRLHDLAVWLARRAPDREPVKVALAMLGTLRGFDDRETILTLSRHQEFTLYATVAITNLEENPDRVLWDIAQHVEGWGRIETVGRLAETTDPEIKAWMLREGYKNSIMYEYLAYTCATAGDLHEALAADSIDDALLDGAGELLRTLIVGQGGPDRGIDDYEHAAVAAERYLHHLSGRANRVDQLVVAQRLERYLASEDGWDDRAQRGWTPEVRRRVRRTVEALTQDEKWPPMVEADLESTDRRRFETATRAAKPLGLEVWHHYYSRTANGEDFWYHLMQTEDREQIEKTVALAEERIPLSEIATGPSDSLGLGPEFRSHSALDSVLQDLRHFPSLGWPLIEAGMRSPVTRNRFMAIRALAAWPRTDWPDGAEAYVRACRDDEPDEDAQATFSKLLAGEPLDY